MKPKSSISHDEAMAKELRENPEFAVEYLRAALEEGDAGLWFHSISFRCL